MIRTYLDAGVLIASVRGHPDLAQSVYDLLEEPERKFVASAFLRLELWPNAIYQRRADEVAFYRQYFTQVVSWADTLDELMDRAEREVARYGPSAMDALHVAAAMLLGADELVTTEGLGKPIHRTTTVRVVAI